MKNIIVFSALPESNHSRKMIDSSKDVVLWASDYSDLSNNRITRMWDPSIRGMIRLCLALRKEIDRGSNVNIQHEFNVYGGAIGIITLPLIMLIFKNKIILTLHSYIPKNSIDKDFLSRFGINIPVAIARFIFDKFFFFMIGLSKKTLVHSDTQKHQIAERFPRLGIKTHVNKIGIDFCYKKPTEVNISNRKYDILIFGYIAPRKGLEYNIEILRAVLDKIENLNVVVAGGVQDKYTSYFKRIKELCCSMPNVRIMTNVKHEHVDDLFQNSKIALFNYTDVLGASGPLNYALVNNCLIVLKPDGIFAETLTDCVWRISGRNISDDAQVLLNAFEYSMKNKQIIVDRKKFHNEYTWNEYTNRTFL